MNRDSGPRPLTSADSPTANSSHAGLPASLAWLPLAILLVGAILRILYAYGSDARNVYDDHFEVTRIMLDEGRWPHPDENWQAYQPPLFHALSALTYRVTSGHALTPPPASPTPEERASAQGVPCRYAWHVAGRKAIQFLCVACGIGTLLLAWLTLRLLLPNRVVGQALGLALVAILPRHIYMSAMPTNDGMTYLWVSLCIYATLRAVTLPARSPTRARAADAPNSQTSRSRRSRRGGSGQRSGLSGPTTNRGRDGASTPEVLGEGRSRYLWWALAGVAAALAMWTKHSGLASLGVLISAAALLLLTTTAAARRTGLRGFALAFAFALALGAWPYVRTYRLTGNPIVSPFTRLPNNMGNQLPGELSQVSWLSWRIPALLHRPWVHLETVDSFWTSLYAELWFDFGTSATVYQYRPWIEFVWPIWRDRTVSGRERERRGLDWELAIMPPSLLWEGRLLIALGILPTALTIFGAAAVWRRTGWVTSSVILGTSAALGLATPVFQTLRQPFRSSMKATFALTAIVAFVVFFAAGYEWLTEKRSLAWLRWLIVADLVLLAAVTTWHFVDLALIFPSSPQYFARREPL